MMRKALIIILFLLLTVNANATDYYVKNGGSDAAAGTSNSTAWATVSKVNSSTQVAGDRVFFDCDSIWRGEVLTPDSGSSSARITYTKYSANGQGCGDKRPLFIGSANKNGSNSWTNDSGNLWSTTATADVGNIEFDRGTYGIKVSAALSVDSDLKFFYNSGTGRVIVYSTTNPGTRFKTIENWLFNGGGIALDGVNWVTIDGFEIIWTGSNGIGGGQQNNNIIRNNKVHDLGGYYLTGTTRAGNGIEVEGNSTHVYIYGNETYNTYDAGITWQTTTQGYGFQDIRVYNNTSYNNEWNYEFFAYNETSTPALSWLFIMGNTGYNAGGGWSHSQRPDPDGTNLKMRGFNTVNVTNCFVQGNIFDESTSQGVWWLARENYNDCLVDHNIIHETTGNIAVILADGGTYSTMASYQAGEGQESGSFSSNPNLANVAVGNLSIQSNSPAINAWTSTSIYSVDLVGRERLRNYDIGAYEFYRPKSQRGIVVSK